MITMASISINIAFIMINHSGVFKFENVNNVIAERGRESIIWIVYRTLRQNLNVNR